MNKISENIKRLFSGRVLWFTHRTFIGFTAQFQHTGALTAHLSHCVIVSSDEPAHSVRTGGGYRNRAETELTTGVQLEDLVRGGVPHPWRPGVFQNAAADVSQQTDTLQRGPAGCSGYEYHDHMTAVIALMSQTISSRWTSRGQHAHNLSPEEETENTSDCVCVYL